MEASKQRLYVENSEAGEDSWHDPPTSSVGKIPDSHSHFFPHPHHDSHLQYCILHFHYSFSSTMARSHKYKNAVRPRTALPPREDSARRVNVTSDIKLATVQSILYKFSTLASAPWHEGHPVQKLTDEAYILQTVRNSSPFVVDLICFQRKEGHRNAIGALVQSFQFPNPYHNLSVCTYPIIHDGLLTSDCQVILFRETRTVEIVQVPKPISGDVSRRHH